MHVNPRPPRKGLPLGQTSVRGFTLLELAAVILIITVFAALAVPTVSAQLRDQRILRSARKIALIYRQARLRALGRGSAMLVRFQAGRFEVREARLGAAAGNAACAELPVSSCVATDWADPAANRLVDWHVEANSGDTANTKITIKDSSTANQPQLDVCFTPMGRAFVRQSVSSAVTFGPLTETYLVTVRRPGRTVRRSRQVVLMPNGTARLSTTPPP